NPLAFQIDKIVPDTIRSDQVPEMCCCFDYYTKIAFTLGNGDNVIVPSSGKKKKKHGGKLNNFMSSANSSSESTVT
ncbi:hypothetical protein H4S08_004890, partial [Coemansia sp. RSA 1365]